jgi:cell division protein FtsA
VALVIDVGGGTTEYVVYSGGVIKHTGVLAVGGDHVSNDLAFGLKVPLGRAEQLKIENGSALIDESVKGRTMNITSELGLPLNTVNVEHLHRIMALRLEEIFQLIAQDLEQAGLLEYLRAGVFLCGGGARVPGLAQLASQLLEMPVSIGKTTSVNGLKSTLDQPEFATPIGLVKFGSFKFRKRDARPSLAQNLKSVFSKLLPR